MLAPRGERGPRLVAGRVEEDVARSDVAPHALEPELGEERLEGSHLDGVAAHVDAAEQRDPGRHASTAVATTSSSVTTHRTPPSAWTSTVPGAAGLAPPTSAASGAPGGWATSSSSSTAQ